MDRLLLVRIDGFKTKLSWSLLAVGTVTLAALAVALFLGASISAPLTRLKDLMIRLADGQTAITVPDRHRTDEVGAMATALEMLRETDRRTRRPAGGAGNREGTRRGGRTPEPDARPGG